MIIFFHKFKSECIYQIKYKHIAKNEINNLTNNGKNTDLYDFNKKLKVFREKSFIFNQINKLTKHLFHIYGI